MPVKEYNKYVQMLNQHYKDKKAQQDKASGKVQG